MEYRDLILQWSAALLVMANPMGVLGASLFAADAPSNSSSSSTNLLEDAIPFGSPFPGGVGFNPAFGGPQVNPAFLGGGAGINPAVPPNLRLRNDLQSPQSINSINLPNAQPSCLGHQPGLYGSPTYGCQVFFVCQADGRLDPMSCPQGTRFNNYLGVCDWPRKVDGNCNPIYSENIDRYSALASLYDNELGGNGQLPLTFNNINSGPFLGPSAQFPVGGGQLPISSAGPAPFQFNNPNQFGGFGGETQFPNQFGGFGGDAQFGSLPQVYPQSGGYGGGFGGAGPQFQSSQALRFPRPAFRSLRTSSAGSSSSSSRSAKPLTESF